MEKDKIISDFSRILYQYKVSSILFATIAIKLNIAFDFSCLMKFH